MFYALEFIPTNPNKVWSYPVFVFPLFSKLQMHANPLHTGMLVTIRFYLVSISLFEYFFKTTNFYNKL